MYLKVKKKLERKGKSTLSMLWKTRTQHWGID